MPPVIVTPDRAGKGFTVDNTRSTSHAADSVGWSPASRETTPVTKGVAIDVPLNRA